MTDLGLFGKHAQSRTWYIAQYTVVFLKKFRIKYRGIVRACRDDGEPKCLCGSANQIQFILMQIKCIDHALVDVYKRQVQDNSVLHGALFDLDAHSGAVTKVQRVVQADENDDIPNTCD